MKIAMVLGAGGPAGHAFHAGVMLALEESLGWDARNARLLVGTSAGAQVAALLRAGLSANDLAARVLGDPLTAEGAQIAQHFVRPDYSEGSRPPRRRWMASPGLIVPALMRGRIGIALSGLLPEGRVDLSVQAHNLRNHFGDDWPEKDLWINAVSLNSGQRVTFGHPTGPKVDVGTAVASSGAIPSVCRPIQSDSIRYVDGGFASLTNIDLVHEYDADLVIVSSPLSRYAPIRWSVRAQVRALRARGTRTLLFEPNQSTSRAIGWNAMSLARAPSVCRATHEQVHGALRTSETSALFSN